MLHSLQSSNKKDYPRSYISSSVVELSHPPVNQGQDWLYLHVVLIAPYLVLPISDVLLPDNAQPSYFAFLR